MNTAPLVSWLLAFFAAYASPPVAGDASSAAETLQARVIVADAYARVALDPSERPLFQGRSARARSALRLAAIAAHESGVKPHLVDGVCWQGECPGGAVGPLQIQVPQGGFTLVGDWVRPCRRGEPGCLGESDVIGSHELAARVALRVLRWGGLEGYTHQPSDGPAVRWVRATSLAFLMSHPAPVTDE